MERENGDTIHKEENTQCTVFSHPIEDFENEMIYLSYLNRRLINIDEQIRRFEGI